MTETKLYQLTLNEEQCNLIIKAIDAYRYITCDVMSYDEIQDRQNKVIGPIFNQLPDELF